MGKIKWNSNKHLINLEKDRKGKETSADEETKKLAQAFKSATSLNSVICL